MRSVAVEAMPDLDRREVIAMLLGIGPENSPGLEGWAGQLTRSRVDRGPVVLRYAFTPG